MLNPMKLTEKKYSYHIDDTILRNLSEDRALEQGVYYRLSAITKQTDSLSVCFSTIIFITKESTVRIGKAALACGAGNIIMIRNPCSYTIIPGAASGVAAFILDLEQDFADTLFLSQIADCPLFYDFIRLQIQDAASPQFLFFDTNERTPVYWCGRVLLYQASFITVQDQKSVRSALVLFLTTLHREHRQHLVISESSMMPQYDAGKFLKYMADNYRSITLEKAAAHFGFNTAYFSTLFKKLEYTTFTHKLQEIRIEQAKRLLLTTNLTMEEIIGLSGFSEKSYFHRSFKKSAGMTPGQYRKSG
jgi:AraC-like DNA-binding protein